MINNIGNDDTYEQTMVLFTQRENGLKYLVQRFLPLCQSAVANRCTQMFDGNPRWQIDAKFKASHKKKYAANDGACALGRIVNVCNYMKHPITQQYLSQTLTLLDKVL